MITIQEWLGKENKLGQDIWTNKYQQNNETFEAWLDRISAGDNDLRNIILEKKFLFGGRILSNRGLAANGKKVTYSNCYVLEAPQDNIESIFNTAGKLARTFSYGGGVGIDISKLAPRGAQVNNTAKETTGSVSFMELYNLVTGLIGQNGRRGALMLSIDCNHPDLEEFISVKNDLNTITKANISVRVDDKFMNAVKLNKAHEMVFIRTETGEEIRRVKNAGVIFKQLCKNNWDYAEPGILYWDRIKEWNLLTDDYEFEYAGVNPCAEEPLPAGGSCLLGSINLSEFVVNGEFDFVEFKRVVKVSVRALNSLLDEGLPLHPLEEQRISVGEWRQIGLGIFGLADMLIKLNIAYGNTESMFICDNIASIMIDEALYTSAELAAELGAYPKYKKDIIPYGKFLERNASPETIELIKKYGLRNSQLLTIAPTGSISTMFGVSGGIEPMYDTHYVRKTESLHDEDVYYNVYTPIVKTYMEANNINEVGELPSIFVTAKTLNPKNRVTMQSIWQDRIDASISSTINLHESATVEDVMELYLSAWEQGLKGLTIFRDNCARLGILSSPATEEKTETEIENDISTDSKIRLDSVKPLSRNDLGTRLSGSTYIKEMACGKLYITINRDENDNLVEVFIDSGKSGGCSANTECLGRYASACMRSGMRIEDIVDVTRGVTCSACSKVKGMGKKLDGVSCGDIVAKTIQEEYDRYHKSDIQKCNQCSGKCNQCMFNTKNTSEKENVLVIHNPLKNPIQNNNNMYICPECGTEMNNTGGCITCRECGYSKCD